MAMLNNQRVLWVKAPRFLVDSPFTPEIGTMDGCTAALVSSAELADFVCRCHAEDLLRWSLYLAKLLFYDYRMVPSK